METKEPRINWLHVVIFYSIAIAFARYLEEIGWRGYLQNALRPIPETRRSLLIGTLWWVWHFRFSSTFELLISPGIVIGSALGLCKMAEYTRSVMVTSGMHLLIIFLTNSGEDWGSKSIAASITITACYFLLRKWNDNRPLQDSPSTSGSIRFFHSKTHTDVLSVAHSLVSAFR